MDRPVNDAGTPENALITFHEWLVDVAWRVHALIRNPGVLGRFHEKIWRWFLDDKLRDTEGKVWMRRREELIDTILAKPRLRDESAGPPQSGWEWWETRRHVVIQDDDGWHHRIVEVAGWAPLDLIRDPPVEHFPLPLSKRPLLIEQKYTLLAAIHDRYCEGVEIIDPWAVRDGDAESAPNGGLKYTILCYHGIPGWLKIENRPAIEVFLADVEADLRTAMGKLVQEPSDGGQPVAALAEPATNGHTLPPNKEGEWSAPMSLQEMARLITGRPDARGREIKPLAGRWGLERLGPRKWRVRLDTMDARTRQKIESPP